MHSVSRKKSRQSGATIMLMLLMLPVFLLPLVGLGVDATRMYIVQSKLSAALDGAALGAGRLLGTNVNTTEIAGEFLNTNYPAGFWGTYNLNYNVSFSSNLGVQKVTVSASVNVPMTFLRVVGLNATTIGDTAVATRAVTRVIMVLDRSGSMNNTDSSGKNVFTMMQQGAEWFAAQFTPNYDELGLVMFSGGAIVAYPEYTLPYNTSPTASGGPDKTFATDPSTQTGQIFDQLKAMAVGGGTGTAEALAFAWIEMQKAHNRDIAQYGVDNVLNTIVLFTDGVPDAISVYANNPSSNSLRAVGSTNCTYNPATSTTTTQMKGYIVAPGKPVTPTDPTGWQPTWAILDLPSSDTVHTLSWWISSSGANFFGPLNPITPVSGCSYLGSNSTSQNSGCGANGNNCQANDLKQIPPSDLYSYPTTGTAYTNSYMTDGTNYWSPNTTSYNPNTPTTGYNVAAASWNETDAIGNTIRNQAIMNPIQIFAIGYSGNGGTDIGLLKRLANTTDSTSFNSSQPAGKFYLVNNTDQLTQAFDQVASSLLRLAQ
jgi:Flp pilus assembly protein TadG